MFRKKEQAKNDLKKNAFIQKKIHIFSKKKKFSSKLLAPP